METNCEPDKGRTPKNEMLNLFIRKESALFQTRGILIHEIDPDLERDLMQACKSNDLSEIQRVMDRLQQFRG